MTRKATSSNSVHTKRNTLRGAAKQNLRTPSQDDADTDGYVPEPPEQLLEPGDELGEELAEEYLISATSGEQVAEDIRNQQTPEDEGGPFVETTSAEEIDYEDDEPEDSEAEPFPTTSSEEEEETE